MALSLKRTTPPVGTDGAEINNAFSHLREQRRNGC
jgi:hypothetical protein